ncbi:class I SAM-dependent methyltransferase [Patescibacteria group bacterium]|nr:class I SAM-dependent methyltransferase [Patescibacteria group bacterium]MBU4458363.1 class I SAM-dependent methyltransferase [Patescibacteria group bacterium]MCG2695882.1 class I SAM-dependent methyltransferase [Candidatus Portnoybacteria bacterium]
MNQIKCIICNKDETKQLFAGKDLLHKVDDTKFNIVKCLNCGLVYLNPQPTLEGLKKYYPPDYKTYQSKKINTSSHKKGVNHKEDQSRLHFLDFGCGSGNQLSEIKKSHPNWALYGLDINEYACKQSIEKGLNIFCGELKDANYKFNYFDIINLNNSLEHLNNPLTTLQQLKNLLKPNGEIIIYGPNFRSLSAKIFKNKWFGLDCPRHLYHFTPKTINQLLEKAGFKTQKIEFDPNPKIFLKTLNYVFKCKNDKTNFILSYLFCWLFRPLSHLLAKFGLTSMMTITAKKL